VQIINWEWLTVIFGCLEALQEK